MVNTCVNVTAPEVLLDLYADRSNFKMFMGDTGLLVTQIAKSSDKTDESLYKALVLDKLSTNMGMVMENAVAQMFASNGRSLYFHEFESTAKNGSRARSYEVDFVIVRGKRICPIEVKSSSYRTHRSLDCFTEKYGAKANERYVLYTKNLSRDGQILYLPMYMAMCL